MKKKPKIRLPSKEKIIDAAQDLAMLAGFFMVLKGLYMVYPPAMWIAGGAWLMLPGQRR